jgi:hypothetical protein
MLMLPLVTRRWWQRITEKQVDVLHYALVFFVLEVIAEALNVPGVAAVATQIARICS